MSRRKQLKPQAVLTPDFNEDEQEKALEMVLNTKTTANDTQNENMESDQSNTGTPLSTSLNDDEAVSNVTGTPDRTESRLSNTATPGRTSRGARRQLYHNQGYTYSFAGHCQTNMAVMFWRCQKKNAPHKCNGRIHTQNGEVIVVITGHNHSPRPDEYPDMQDDFSAHPLNHPTVASSHHRPRKNTPVENGDLTLDDNEGDLSSVGVFDETNGSALTVDFAGESSPSDSVDRGEAASGADTPVDKTNNDCTFCAKHFDTRTELNDHEQQAHSHQMPYRCKHCSKGFKHKRSMERHELLHTGTKNFICNQCGAAFFRSDHLKVHYKIHKDRALFEESASTSLLNQSSSLVDIANTDEHNLCSVCGETLSSSEALLTHMDERHATIDKGLPITMKVDHDTLFSGTAINNPSSNLLACSLCNRTFNDIAALQTHTLTKHANKPPSRRKDVDEVQYTCVFCPRTFDGLLALHEHMASHEQSQSNGHTESLECSQCATTFQQFDKFAEHMSLHQVAASPSSSYSCAICAQVFVSQTQYSEHVLSVHFVRRRQCFTCSVCINTNPKTCTFDRSNHLQRHLIDFHALVLYKCALCGTLVDSKTDMQMHFAVAHCRESVQWRCARCCSVFGSRLQLETHVQHIHVSDIQPRTDADYLVRPSTSGAKPQHLNHSHQPDALGDKFHCPFCSHRFTSVPHLEQHVKQDHYALMNAPQQQASHYDDAEQRMFNAPPPLTRAAASIGLSPHDAAISATSTPKKHVTATANWQPPTIQMISGPVNTGAKSTEDDIDQSPVPPPHTGKPQKCNICDAQFTESRDYAEHKLQHCKVGSSRSCLFCDYSVTSSEDYLSHTQHHNVAHNQIVSCILCKQSLMNTMELEMHARFHLSDVKVNGRSNGSDQPLNTANVKLEVEERMDGEQINRLFDRVQEDTETVSLECQKCDQTFGSESDLLLHSGTHQIEEDEGEFGYKCYLCEEIVSTESNLQSHLLDHSFAGCNEFRCCICSATFSSAAPLQVHLTANHDSSACEYECADCPAKFFYRTELDNHSLWHDEVSGQPTGDVIMAGEDVLANLGMSNTDTSSNTDQTTGSSDRSAGQDSTSQTYLEQLLANSKHSRKRKSKHPVSSDDFKSTALERVTQMTPASRKNKTLTSMLTGQLARTLVTGELYPCPHCPKQFVSLAALQGHSHVHMQVQRNHICPLCGKGFATGAKLRNHQRQHRGDKPFECEVCGKNFSRKDNLKVHMKQHLRSLNSSSPSSSSLFGSLPTMVPFTNDS